MLGSKCVLHLIGGLVPLILVGMCFDNLVVLHTTNSDCSDLLVNRGQIILLYNRLLLLFCKQTSQSERRVDRLKNHSQHFATVITS